MWYDFKSIYWNSTTNTILCNVCRLLSVTRLEVRNTVPSQVKHNLLAILHSREIRCKPAEKITNYHTVGEWKQHTENLFQKAVEVTELWWILHIEHEKTKKEKLNSFDEAASINYRNGNLITQDKVLVLAAKEQWLHWHKLLLAIFLPAADWRLPQQMMTEKHSRKWTHIHNQKSEKL